MNNPETLASFSTRDTGLRQTQNTKEKTKNKKQNKAKQNKIQRRKLNGATRAPPSTRAPPATRVPPTTRAPPATRAPPKNRGKPRYSSRFRLKNVYPRLELSHFTFETETDYCNLHPNPLIPASAIWMTSTTDTLKSASYSDFCQEIYDEGRSRTN